LQQKTIKKMNENELRKMAISEPGRNRKMAE
jgi:hypothetical protein